MDDLTLYLRLVREKWPLAIPALATTILAGVSFGLGKKHPLLLPGVGWLLLAAACLITAQFLVWRDTHHGPVDPPHADRLRTIAGKIYERVNANALPLYTDGNSQAPLLRKMFSAHFPMATRRIEAYRSARQRQEDADAAIVHLIETEAPKRFPGESGWFPDKLIRCCCLEAIQLVTSDADVPIALDGASPSLIWRSASHVLRQQAGPHQMAEVQNWVHEIFGSEEANEYGRAIEATNQARLEAIEALDPVVYDLPVRKAAGCTVCFPIPG
jgi:hypothetical protein